MLPLLFLCDWTFNLLLSHHQLNLVTPRSCVGILEMWEFWLKYCRMCAVSCLLQARGDGFIPFLTQLVACRH